MTTTLTWHSRVPKRIRRAVTALCQDHFEGAEERGSELVIYHAEKDLGPLGMFLFGKIFRDIKTAREGQENPKP